MKPYLDQAILHQLLLYDPATGVFTWRERENRDWWNRRYAGKRAGYAWKPSGNIQYWCIRVFDWPFMAHRLAHLYMTGAWPENEIDHRDLDGLNNRWDNLRPATKSENIHNRRAPRTNKTGFKGVSFSKGRYRALIYVAGKQIFLGHYKTPDAAYAAYCEAAVKYRPEFGRVA